MCSKSRRVNANVIFFRSITIPFNSFQFLSSVMHYRGDTIKFSSWKWAGRLLETHLSHARPRQDWALPGTCIQLEGSSWRYRGCDLTCVGPWDRTCLILDTVKLLISWAAGQTAEPQKWQATFDKTMYQKKELPRNSGAERREDEILCLKLLPRTSPALGEAQGSQRLRLLKRKVRLPRPRHRSLPLGKLIFSAWPGPEPFTGEGVDQNSGLKN